MSTDIPATVDAIAARPQYHVVCRDCPAEAVTDRHSAYHDRALHEVLEGHTVAVARIDRGRETRYGGSER